MSACLAHRILYCTIFMKQADSSPKLDEDRQNTGETAYFLKNLFTFSYFLLTYPTMNPAMHENDHFIQTY